MSPSLVLFCSVIVAQPAAADTSASTPPPIKVLVLDTTGDVPPGVKVAAQATLVTEVSGLERFEAVSTRELTAAMGVEAEKQALGCDETSCLTEVAGALDADIVLIVQVSALAETFLISVSAFSSATTSVVSATQMRASSEAGVPYAVVAGLEPLLSRLVSITERSALTAALTERAAAVRDRDAGAGGLKTAITEAAREAASAAVEETARDSGAEAGAEAAEALLARALKERAEVRFGPQSGPKVYIADPSFSGVDASLSKGLLNTMSQAAQTEGLSVMTAEDIRDLLKRISDQTALGVDDNVDEKSFASLGAAIGVRHLVAVTFTQDNNDTVVQTRLINAELSEVVNRREVRASRWGGSLQEAAQVAIRVVLSPVFAGLQGEVTLEVTEEGASVAVDDDVIGVTPLQQPLRIPGGTHIVSVTKDGFIRYQETVKITAGTELERKVLLRPSEDFAASYKWRTYGTLGAATALTAMGVPAVVGGLGGITGWLYIYFVKFPEINSRYQGLPELVPGPPGGPATIRNPELTKYDEEIQFWSLASTVFSVLGWAPFLVGVPIAFGGVAAWFFVENPFRYDDLVANAEE